MMEENEKTLSDYLQILKRRKGLLVWPIAGLLFITIVITLALPSIYESSATILIEQQDIPQDLVRSTITTYADQRLQIISQRVMTSANLKKIINGLKLYPDLREKQTITAIVELMREDINMEMVSADVVDPRSGRPTQATIAFTLTYESKSPDLAQKVVNELVSLYLSENIKTRTEKTEQTSSFLTEEANKLNVHIIDLETKLATFKEKNVGRLPELVSLNMQLMERTDRELSDVEGQIRTLEERKVYLAAELSQLDPTTSMYSETGERILGSRDRLKLLKTQYITLASRYSPTHPDVEKTSKEIAALEKEIGGNTDTSELELQLEGKRAELATTRKKYTAKHPEVKKLERSVASLKAALKKAKKAYVKDTTLTSKPDNPAYIQMTSQLEAANTELRSFTQRRNKLKDKLTDLEQRLLDTPQVEREYRALTRDHQNATAKYQDIKAKQMEAKLGEALEKGQKGERLSLIEPPLRAEEPIKPNRKAILFLGFIFSISAGVGTVAVAESMDNTIRDTSSLVNLLRIAPLGVIPYMGTEQTNEHRKKKLKLILGLLLVGIIIALLLFHLLVKPLDVTWFVALRKLGF